MLKQLGNHLVDLLLLVPRKHIPDGEKAYSLRGDLLCAVVGVICQEREDPSAVNRREAGDLQGRPLIGVSLERREAEMFGGTHSDHGPGDGDYRRVGRPHLDGDFLAGLVPVTLGGDSHCGCSGSGGLKVEPDHLVPRLVELDGSAGVTRDLKRTVNLDTYTGVPDPVLKREDIDRHHDLLSGADDSRQGRENHKRRPYRYGLLGVAVGSVPCRDKHHPDASDVHGKLDLMCGRAALQRERAEVPDHCVEPVVLLRAGNKAFIASDAEHRRESSAVGSDDIIVEIPSADAERLPGIHRVPRIRSLERCEVQKTFVNNGQCVCHRLAVLLIDLDLEFFLGTDHIRHRDDRLKVRLHVVDQHRTYSVEPDRKVVVGPFVRLHKGDVDVEVRSHLLGDLE